MRTTNYSVCGLAVVVAAAVELIVVVVVVAGLTTTKLDSSGQRRWTAVLAGEADLGCVLEIG